MINCLIKSIFLSNLKWPENFNRWWRRDDMLDAGEGIQTHGLWCRKRAGCRKAIEFVKNKKIDIYFLDINLPGMNGIELCKRLKRERPTAFFFAITGFSSVFDLVKCREAGFDDYFIKPITIKDIVEAVEEAINRIARWKKGK